jgi:hypothetical protein
VIVPSLDLTRMTVKSGKLKLEERDRRRGTSRPGILERFAGGSRPGSGLRGHVREARRPKAEMGEAIGRARRAGRAAASGAENRARARRPDRAWGLVEPASGLRVENEEMKVSSRTRSWFERKLTLP